MQTLGGSALAAAAGKAEPSGTGGDPGGETDIGDAGREVAGGGGGGLEFRLLDRSNLATSLSVFGRMCLVRKMVGA